MENNSFKAMETVWTEEKNARWHNVIDAKTEDSNIKTKNFSGKSYRFVSPAYVTSKLNEAFEKWTFEVVTHSIERVQLKAYRSEEYTEKQYVYVLGRLTVPGLGSREQFGCQAILETADIGVVSDTIKGATSDALKKCASLFGIALDLYDDVVESNMQNYGTKPATTGYAQSAPARTAPAQTTNNVTPAKPPVKPAEDNTWSQENIKKYNSPLTELSAIWKQLGLTSNAEKTPFVVEFTNDQTAVWPKSIAPSNIVPFVEHMRTKISE